MRIRCAICNRPVDNIEVWRLDYDFSTVIRVRCHGATDEMRLSDFDLARMTNESRRQLEQSEGIAFTRLAALSQHEPSQTET